MEQLSSLGLIGGGQMGEALLRGLLQAKIIAPSRIAVAEPVPSRRRYLEETYGISSIIEPSGLCAKCSTIILAVKPQVMSEVLESYRGHINAEHLVISIAAGVTLNDIEAVLGHDIPTVRVMPNTPALVLCGASAYSPNRTVSDEGRQRVKIILEAVGTCMELPEEQLDAVTGLSGSGPGYVFTFIEAMIDGGVRAGLTRDAATELTLQTFLGSARLAVESGEHPALLKGRVTSPGGTTIAGIQVLEEAGVRGAIMAAVTAATNRSRQLS